MFTFETFYTVCFVAGFVYGVVMGLLSAVFGGDHDVSGGHEMDLGSGDFSGTADFSPLSPVVISTFLVMFGGSGLIYIKMFGIDEFHSLLPALVTALGSGVAVFWVFSWVFSHTQGGVETNLAELVGCEAEVITAIPAGGMGEIAFVSAGGRVNATAQSDSGQTIPRNSVVRISKIVGNVYFVRPVDQEKPASAAPAAPGESA